MYENLSHVSQRKSYISTTLSSFLTTFLHQFVSENSGGLLADPFLLLPLPPTPYSHFYLHPSCTLSTPTRAKADTASPSPSTPPAQRRLLSSTWYTSPGCASRTNTCSNSPPSYVVRRSYTSSPSESPYRSYRPGPVLRPRGTPLAPFCRSA